MAHLKPPCRDVAVGALTADASSGGEQRQDSIGEGIVAGSASSIHVKGSNV